MSSTKTATEAYNAPLGDVAADRFIRYGGYSALGGAGVAIAMKILSDIQQNRKDKADTNRTKHSPEVLEIKLPPAMTGGGTPEDQTKVAQALAKGIRAADDDFRKRASSVRAEFPAVRAAQKVAGIGDVAQEWWRALGGGDGPIQAGDIPTHPLGDLPLTVAATALPGIATYKILDRYFKGQERKELENQIAKIKGDYSTLLLKDIESQAMADEEGREKTASAPSVCEALIDIMVEQKSAQDGVKKEAASRALNTVLSFPVLLSLLAGATTHRYSLNKEREIDDYYNKLEKKKVRPPTRVKLVSQPPPTPGPADREPTAAEEEASEIDSQKAAGYGTSIGGGALIGAAAYPGIAALLKKVSGGRIDMTQIRSYPEMAVRGAVLGGVIGGIGEQGRQIEELENQIEGDDEDKKKASYAGPALLGIKMFEMSDREPSGLQTKLEARESEEEAALAEKQEALAREHPVEQVDRNTIVLNTPSGQVVVDAADPEALNYLVKNQDRIVDSLTATPENVPTDD